MNYVRESEADGAKNAEVVFVYRGAFAAPFLILFNPQEFLLLVFCPRANQLNSLPCNVDLVLIFSLKR